MVNHCPTGLNRTQLKDLSSSDMALLDLLYQTYGSKMIDHSRTNVRSLKNKMNGRKISLTKT